MSEYLLFIPLTFIFISLIYWTLALGIGPTPSSARVINAISKCLPETIDGDVIELGCGWGHLLPSLKNRYPENPLIGYERSPVPCHYSRWRLRQMSIRNEDLFQADVSKAGLLVCYLYPGAMDRIAQRDSSKPACRMLATQSYLYTARS